MLVVLWVTVEIMKLWGLVKTQQQFLCMWCRCSLYLCLFYVHITRDIFSRFGFRTVVPDTKSSRLRAASLRALRCPGCLHHCQTISTIHRSAAQTDHIYWPCTDTWTVSVSSLCCCKQTISDTQENTSRTMLLEMLYINNLFLSLNL